jgi:eukaryotic-like serine/threonine-protein kinase
VSEGLSFGAYRVVRKVGQGGMGAVYLGEHTLIGRRAAIKVLHRHRSSQRESIERFFTEARATSAVEDPGIVQIYDFGVTPSGTAYLVMEYLDGEPLSARLRRLRVLAPHDAVRITRQIAGSLASAHALGIIHRDLKPENLFMVRDPEAAAGERPKILDFGIAKLGDDARGGSHRTRTGAVMGTPAYMSPEQCNDTGKIDARTDVYSLGCVLFLLLTGRPPFDVVGTGAMISAHLKDAAPRPSEVAPHLPEIVDPLIARCLAKRPEDRFATMIELQRACDAVLAQLPSESATATVFDPLPPIAMRADSTTTLGTSAGESTAGSGPRKLGTWIAVSAIAVAAGVVLAVMTTRSSGRDDSAIAPTTTVVPAPALEQPEIQEPEPAPKPEPKPEPKLEPKPEPTIEEPETSTPAVEQPPPARTPTPRPPPTRKAVPKKPKPPAGNLYDDRI